MDSNRSLSDSWKGCTRFTLLKEKPPKGYMWSRGNENARRLRGTYFIDPEDGEYEETIKKTKGESWRFQRRRRCLAKTDQRSTPGFRKLKRRVVNSTRFQKTKHACIVEAHEATGKLLESSLPKIHEDHIAGKGHHSMSHYDLYTNLFRCLKR